MKYILVLTVFAAFLLVCSNSPQPAGSPTPVVEMQSPAPASEPLAPAEAAPTPSSGTSDGDAGGVFYYLQSGEREPSPRILPFMDPPPLDEEACEIYAPADGGGLKVLGRWTKKRSALTHGAPTLFVDLH